eukprot:scaffold133941_cov18-Tisochrysis_lutea.AAC.1
MAFILAFGGRLAARVLSLSSLSLSRRQEVRLHHHNSLPLYSALHSSLRVPYPAPPPARLSSLGRSFPSLRSSLSSPFYFSRSALLSLSFSPPRRLPVSLPSRG